MQLDSVLLSQQIVFEMGNEFPHSNPLFDKLMKQSE